MGARASDGWVWWGGAHRTVCRGSLKTEYRRIPLAGNAAGQQGIAKLRVHETGCPHRRYCLPAPRVRRGRVVHTGAAEPEPQHPFTGWSVDPQDLPLVLAGVHPRDRRVVDVSDGSQRRLTDEDSTSAVWSPSGRAIVFDDVSVKRYPPPGLTISERHGP